jgi:protein TonB
MNHQPMLDEEFDMLLNEVLDTLANPEPTEALQNKVILRLRLVEAALRPEPTGARVLLFPDRVASRRSLSPVAWALGVHAAAVLLIALLFGSKLRMVPTTTDSTAIALTVPPLHLAPSLRAAGGGGGQRGVAPMSRGTPPKDSPDQVLPPKAPPLELPKLAVAPTIEADLKMATALPNIGVANGPSVGVSMGTGGGNGFGSGDGNGMGPGSGGGYGGGVREVGGGVSAPVVIYRVDPEFSEEARKAKVSGNVLVNLWVDRYGRVTHVKVLKGLGMGLDEKAIEAVKQFRFKPAMENGKPVTVELNIDVNFQIF